MNNRVRNVVSFFKQPSNLIGFIIVLAFFVIAIIGPSFVAYDPFELDPGNRLRTPSGSHIFGTDPKGRDILTRVIYGAGISLRASLIIVGGSLLIGFFFAFVATKYGGLVDELLMRLCDLVISFPPLLLGMIIIMILGRSLENAILAVVLTRWPDFARLIRAQIITEKSKAYVEAARSIGGTEMYIFRKQILRNIYPQIVIKITLDIGVSILFMASLSFIGLGASPPIPEWGAMITQGRNYIITHPWIPLFPGMAIFCVVLGFSLLGDGLRDLADPRSK